MANKNETELERLRRQLAEATTQKNSASAEYTDYVRRGYTPSEEVQQQKNAYMQARERLNNYTPYSNPNAAAMQQALSTLVDRPAFKFSTDGDALYERYKNDYQAMGRRAMEDTVGQVSALTGGYGNSYGATAGAQAYNDYISRMDEVVPELYRLALDKYNAEGDRLRQNYDLLAADDDRGYARWAADRDIAADLADRLGSDYRDERSFDYGLWGDRRNAYQTAYEVARDAYGDAYDAEDQLYGRNRDEEQTAYERAREADQTAYDRYMDQVNLSLKASGGGGGSGGSGGNEGTGEVKYAGWGDLNEYDRESLDTLAKKYRGSHNDADADALLREIMEIEDTTGWELSRVISYIQIHYGISLEPEDVERLDEEHKKGGGRVPRAPVSYSQK